MTIRKPYFIIFALAALSILALGFRAATVNAADAVRASRLDIEIWPEFDKAGMALVIMRVQLPTEAALPASINLRLPASVSAP